jgi:hypothetical protein
VTNLAPGSVVVNFPPAVAGANGITGLGGLVFTANGTTIGSIRLTSTTGLGNVITYYATASPSTTNFFMAGVGNQMFFNAGSELGIGIAGSFGSGLDVQAAGVQLLGRTTDFGSGSGVLGVTASAANPSATLTTGGNFVVFGDHGATNGLEGWSSAKVQTTIAPQGTGTANTQLRQHLSFDAVQRVTSTSATTIWTSPSITASHVVTYNAICSAIDTTTLSSSAGASLSGTYVNAAGTVSLLGSVTTVYNHNFTTAPSLTVSGTTLLLKVTANTTDATDEQCLIDVEND